MKIPIGSTLAGRICKPKAVPFPKISRTKPAKVKAMVNPRPIPKPSIMESTGGFLEAYASARPKIIQLTTINGI